MRHLATIGASPRRAPWQCVQKDRRQAARLHDTTNSAYFYSVCRQVCEMLVPLASMRYEHPFSKSSRITKHRLPSIARMPALKHTAPHWFRMYVCEFWLVGYLRSLYVPLYEPEVQGHMRGAARLDEMQLQDRLTDVN